MFLNVKASILQKSNRPLSNFKKNKYVFAVCMQPYLEYQNISDLHTERISMLEEKHFEISKPMTLYSLKNVKIENYVYGMFYINYMYS